MSSNVVTKSFLNILRTWKAASLLTDCYLSRLTTWNAITPLRHTSLRGKYRVDAVSAPRKRTRSRILRVNSDFCALDAVTTGLLGTKAYIRRRNDLWSR